MKIVFDNIMFSKEKQGGISNYWYEIVSRAQTEPGYECFFYEEKYALDNLCRQRLSIPETEVIKHKLRSLMLARMSSINVPIADSFIYHSSYYRPLKNKQSNIEVTTVHDFTHSFYSSFLRKIMHNYLKYRTLRVSDGIICVSNNTCNDLYKIFGTLKGKEIAVIHNGVSNDYYPVQSFTPEQNHFLASQNIDNAPYMLYVGARTPYKNFDFVVNLLTTLKNMKLVVVGKPFDSRELKFIPEELMNRIVVTNHISNETLNVLYNKAHCLLYPSSYEGFGIPVVEAMRAGCPVVGLNKSSMPEVAGSSALLMDTLNLNEFTTAINQLGNHDFRSQIIAKGLEQSQKFSWDKCAKETFDFYNHLYALKHK